MAAESSTAVLGSLRFRALIADQQSIFRRALSQALCADASIEVVGECASGKEAIAAIAQHAPDMLFVDVHLPDVPGFQVVQSCERVPAVVFTSAQDGYAARAFDADAADYIVKPFREQRLAQAVQRAKMRVEMERRIGTLDMPVTSEGNSMEAVPARRYLDRLALRNRGRIFFQKVQDVSCFASDANYVQVYCAGAIHRMRSTMNELEAQLDPRSFVRIHRCTIINVEFLRDFRPLPHGDYQITMKDGKELTMSRNYRQQFRAVISALSFTQ